MAIASIKAWLNLPDRHYLTGVALYDQYGTKASLKIFFKAGDSAYHQQRLRDALEELSESTISDSLGSTISSVIKLPINPAVTGWIAKPMELPAADAKPQPLKRHSLSDEEWAKTPDQIKDLYTKVSRLKSRSDLSFHQLFIATSDAKRLELALSRLRDNDEINRTWKQIREYQASGKITEQLEADSQKSVDKLSIKELFAVVTNYPTYITKANKRIAGYPPGHKKEKAMRELKEKEIYLAAARRRVDNE